MADKIHEFKREIFSQLHRNCVVQMYSATYEGEDTIARINYLFQRANRRPIYDRFDYMNIENQAVRNDGRPSFSILETDVALNHIIQVNIDLRDPPTGKPRTCFSGMSKEEAILELHKSFDPKKALVFFATKNILNACLKAVPWPESFTRNAYHGDLTGLGDVAKTQEQKENSRKRNQEERVTVMKNYVATSGQSFRTLFSTDLLARGFDLPKIDFVINANVPREWTKDDEFMGSVSIKGDVLTVEKGPCQGRLHIGMLVKIEDPRGSEYGFYAYINEDVDNNKFRILRQMSQTDDEANWVFTTMSPGTDLPKVKATCNNKDSKGVCKPAPSYTKYKHRIGRTGRFNTFGLAINLIKSDAEEMAYRVINQEMVAERLSDPNRRDTYICDFAAFSNNENLLKYPAFDSSKDYKRGDFVTVDDLRFFCCEVDNKGLSYGTEEWGLHWRSVPGPVRHYFEQTQVRIKELENEIAARVAASSVSASGSSSSSSTSTLAPASSSSSSSTASSGPQADAASATAAIADDDFTW